MKQQMGKNLSELLVSERSCEWVINQKQVANTPQGQPWDWSCLITLSMSCYRGCAGQVCRWQVGVRESIHTCHSERQALFTGQQPGHQWGALTPSTQHSHFVLDTASSLGPPQYRKDINDLEFNGGPPSWPRDEGLALWAESKGTGIVQFGTETAFGGPNQHSALTYKGVTGKTEAGSIQRFTATNRNWEVQTGYKEKKFTLRTVKQRSRLSREAVQCLS